MDIYHRPVVWRDRLFDSTLEANWFSSLTVYGVDWIHHPGSLRLSDGREYQPDGLLKNSGTFGVDILFEVKGYGIPGLDKALLCQQDNPQLVVLVGRPPHEDENDIGPFLSAVWHRADGSPYEWDVNGKDEIFYSGEVATADKPGLKFYGAIANSRFIM